ncbi:hypothetical protein [Sulfurimonas sp.]
MIKCYHSYCRICLRKLIYQGYPVMRASNKDK